MKEFLKQNTALVLAFLLPFILIIGVVISSYVPSLFIKTNYNFIYAYCTNQNYYNCDATLPKKYTIDNGKLVSALSTTTSVVDTNKNGVPDANEYTSRLFLHDTKTNTSREITLGDAQSLTLSGLLTSPDGASVSGRYDRNGGDFFPFGGGSSSFNYYLVQGKGSIKLNLIQNSNYYYQNNFEFIGWVTPGRNN